MTTKLDYSLDQIDYQILRIMQENARTNNADIARELGMAPSAILERVKKLEQKEVILQYNAKINPDAVDQKLLSFIFIKAQDPIGTQKVGLLLAKIPEVQEVHDIAGDDGYLIKVRTNDAKGLVELMRNSLGKIGEIISTRTTIVLETVKEEQKLVIPTIEDK
ncbi:Lrp/AsnC family transcriptional regulator [Sphingobacterium sp. FBM7-1]|uniref:Lrp/AsnC family transcriptional regulator n=1 Tax=Sphingobacterium sp. FBM7-1 TaxID=2886688 RepID=UPI001D11C16D|nr:Lrp/AsnC family transcriptional regulator [Sphingobacterium sp. FBM7-1]MCC2600542.1 Lrp/AsnC family transcriptional regulator [Sphingobacterium sp. FBM7-1]